MQTSIRYLIIASLIFCGLSFYASHAQTLVEYDIRNITWNGDPLPASTVETDVSATPITVTGPAGYDDDFWGGSSSNMFLANWQSTLNMSQNYYEFTISAEPGNLLFLSDITVGVASETGGNFQGPQTYRLYSSISGFSSGDFIAEQGGFTSGFPQNTLTASLGAEYDGIDEVTFRVYGFNGVASSEAGGGLSNFVEGTFSYGGFNFNVQGTGSNVIISGTVEEAVGLVINTPSVSNIQQTEATFSSNIPSDGGETVTGRGFVYSPTAVNSDPEIGESGVVQITSGAGEGSFTESATGLNSVTQYSVRAYAITASGTTYSQVTTFATPGPELLRYDIAAISSFDGQPVSASFTADHVTSQPLTVDLTDLQIDTDFWEPLAEGIFLTGWQESLDMSKNYFEFTIEAETDFLLNLATISVGVGREFSSNIRGPQVFRLYSSVDGFGSGDYIAEAILDPPGSGIYQTILSTTLGSGYSGISSATFRVYGYEDVSTGPDGEVPGGGLVNISSSTVSIGGFNFDVLGSGSDIIISGTSVGPPTVSADAATGISATSATLGGQVTDDGGAVVSEHGIVWGLSENPTIDDDFVVAMGSGSGSFSSAVSLLPFGTVIHYRAFATNLNGTGYSSNNQFTTGDELTLEFTGQPGWRLFSVPAAVSLADFLEPLWTQGAEGSDHQPGNANIFRWSDSPENDNTPWNPVTNLNTNAQAGEGLLIYVYQDDDYDAGGGTFPKLLPLTGTEFAPFASAPTNTHTDGFTLLGNPFGSSLSFDQFFDDASGITGTVYVWDPNDNTGDGGTGGALSGSWKTWSVGTGVGDLTDGIIAPFQGFFVQNTSSDGGVSSVDFAQETKATGGDYLGRPEQQHLVRLELSGQGMRDSAWLVFNDNGSEQRSIHDALQLGSLSHHHATAAAIKSDGNLYDIAHLPSLNSDFSMDLMLNATKPGSYTVDFSHADLPGNLPLFLVDSETGTSVKIENGESYTFTIDEYSPKPEKHPIEQIAHQSLKMASTSMETRFIVTTDPDEFTGTPDNELPVSLHLYQNYPNPFNPVTRIKYDLPESGQVTIEVFNIQGQRVATLVNTTQTAGTHTVSFDASSLSSGIYLYRLQTGAKSLTGKMMLVK